MKTFNNLRPTLILIACAFLLSLFSQPSYAKTEYRSISWAWCIWDCEYYGDYPSSDEALAAYNTFVDQSYNQCLASKAGAECGTGCSKNNSYNAAVMTAGLTTILSGQPNFLSTTSNIRTAYGPPCKGDPGIGTVVGDSGGGIATYGKDLCPDSGGWAVGRDPATTYVDTPSGQVTAYTVWCWRDVPDCPT